MLAIHNQLKKKDRGFTLIELLLIAIGLAVLATIVIAVVPNISQQTKSSAFATTLSTLQSATDRFYADANQYPTASQPVAGTSAQQIDGTAVDSKGDTFLGAYLRFAPDAKAANMGLDLANGATVYYGVTASGRVFATQDDPSTMPWDGTENVYLQEDPTNPVTLSTIW